MRRCGTLLLLLALGAPAALGQSVLTTIAAGGPSSIAPMADVDGDGSSDIAAAYAIDYCGKGKMRGAARIWSSASGELLLELVGLVCGQDFGMAALGLDDIDGEGVPDLLVTTGHGAPEPLVQAFSGATGSEIWRRLLPVVVVGENFDALGQRLVDAVGDVDGDGIGDFVLSLASGAAVCSGRDGATIAMVATDLGGLTPNTVSGLGDADLDGVPDAVVSSWTASAPGLSRVTVFSARTGQTLFEVAGEATPPGGTADEFGRRLAGPGDVDGDGRADVLVTLAHDPSAGRDGLVRVLSGDSGTLLLGATPSITGPGLDIEVAHLGDYDLDGRADLLVGSPSAFGPGIGAVQVLAGKDGAEILSIESQAGSAGFGGTLAGLGELDGDAVPDFVVGALSAFFGGNGSLFVFGGPLVASPQLLSLAGAPGERLGESLARLGDIDGDGREDLAVGAPGGVGAVRFVSGFDGAPLFSAVGGAVGADFGKAIAPVGDVNGDGWSDVIIGAPLAAGAGLEAGEVQLVSGADGVELWSVSGTSAGERFGSAVCGVGDVDLDGVPDVAAGAPRADDAALNAGAARLLAGASGAELAVWFGDAATDALGSAVAGPGDLDGDGLPDLALGAPKAAGQKPDSGLVRLVSGTGAVLDSFEAVAGATSFGAALAAAGDRDGDGTPDLLVGAPAATQIFAQKGQALVLSGDDGRVLLLVSLGEKADHFGAAVASADVDRDGLPDVLAGAPDPTGEPLAWAVSATSGKPLLSVPGLASDEAFGRAVCGADVNGDGYADLVVGAPQADDGSGRVAVFSFAPQWTSVAAGIAGVAGLPQLAGDGTLIPGELLTVTLGAAAPHAIGRLVLGTQKLLLPFKGGVLVPAASAWVPFVTDAAGGATFAGPWPGDLPAGSSVFLQAWVVDHAAPQGVAGSNGLEGHIP
ncbi:MAG TPA: FG-GAP-like repeat-containing protein [Planctomycetota bacterium]|nr:FG-GAP-like repeat-containing protein [Planctomycetota bacterium]